MTNDELKLYNSFKNATPEQQQKFTEDDWTEAERLAELYKSYKPTTETPEYKSAYTKLKEDGLKLGYSGLSDEQKEMIKAAYPQSLAGKAGVPFEQMTAKMDAQATDQDYVNQSPEDRELANLRALQYGNEGGNAYTLGRDVLSTVIGPIMGTAEYAKDRLFKEGGWASDKPLTEYFKEALELGNKGEGATGIIASPENYVPMARLGIGGTALTQGLVGGGTHFMNAENPTLSGTAIAAGIGGALGGLTKGILGAPERRLGQKATEVEELGMKYKMAEDEYSKLQETAKQLSKTAQGMKLSDNKIIDPLARKAYQTSKLESGIDLTRSPWMANDVENIAGTRAAVTQLDSRIDAVIKSQLAQKEAEAALGRSTIAENILNERKNRPLYNEKDPGMIGWIAKEGEKVPYLGGVVGPVAKKLVFGLSNRAEPLYPKLRAVGDILVQPTTKFIDRKYNK